MTPVTRIPGERGRLFSVSGFQPDDAPHWSTAIIEATSEAEAREILLQDLLSDRNDTVWGWGDVYGNDYQAAETWRVTEITEPLLFVLGGGCR